jgi:hypothetical protein
MNAPFEQHRIKERQVILDRHFSNDKNALQLISRLVD